MTLINGKQNTEPAIDDEYFKKGGKMFECEYYYTDVSFRYPLYQFLKYYVSKSTSPNYVFGFHMLAELISQHLV
jgi:hypothetical protein